MVAIKSFIKDLLINYGFKNNENQLHITWIKNKILFYIYRTLASFFIISIYIIWIDKK